MAFLRNKKKIAAVSRKTPEITRSSQSQNALYPEMTQEYISQVSEEIEGRVTKKLSKEFSRTESRILCPLSKLDDFFLNPQVRTCSVAVPGTSRNSDSENWEPTGDRSLNDLCPEAMFSSHHSGNLNGSELEESHHTCHVFMYEILNFFDDTDFHTDLMYNLEEMRFEILDAGMLHDIAKLKFCCQKLIFLPEPTFFIWLIKQGHTLISQKVFTFYLNRNF